MKTWFARIGFALLLLVLVAFIGLATWEPFLAEKGEAPDTDRTYSAEIVRSEFGVPYIYGKTDADVAFGIAIAHAEDDFFTLQDVMAMTRGRYGAIAGEDGAAVDYMYHLLDARGTAERQFGDLPEGTRAVFDAYAAGLNHYARQNPGEIKLDRLFPVKGEDIAAGYALRQPFFFGLANVIQPLVEGEPLRPEFGPPIPQENLDGIEPSGEPIMEESEQGAASARSAPFGEDRALNGSNAFAIAPQKSGDGVTRLVSNSHQPWRGAFAWYEMVVESEEGWHFAGVNLPGTPYPVMGHNRNLGWTYTVNRPDLIDIYELEVETASGSDGEAYRYRLDGEWRDLEHSTVTLPVRLGPIVLPIRRDVFRSEHGPVIRNDKGWFAIRYAGIDDLAQADAYYRLGKAENFDEWLAVMARMDIPSFNSVYADAAGNIAYIYNASFPDRKKGANWRTILPGDDSSLIWRRKADFSEVPKQINPSSGWLFNANNAPWSAAGEADDLDPNDFAPELGIENKTTNRARRAAKLLSEAALIDRANLERIKYDTGYEREGYVRELWDGLAALDLRGEADLAKARDLLLDWDFTADNVGRADALALLMIKDFMSAEYQNKPMPVVEDELRKHVDHLMRHFGRIDPPMSDLLRLRQGKVDLPLDGGSDTLRASTTWDVHDDGRLSVRHGDSFVMFIEWAPGERVRSESIQPYGAATTRPGSRHYADQAPLFVNKQLKPVHFWRVDALDNAVRRKTVTNR